MFGSVVNKGGFEFENPGYMHGISCISIVGSAERSYKDDKRVLLVEDKATMAMEKKNGSNTYSSSSTPKDDKRVLLFEEKATVAMEKKIEEKKNGSNTYSSSSSTSSIGKNSDVSGNSIENNSEDIEEVQSSYKGPLDAMEALEEVLPIRRGISRFYKGKSKSFASLADAASVKDLAKPENAYAKRRRNQLACSLYWDKNRNFPLRSNNGGISKRVTNSSRTTLALAVAMNSSASDSNDSLNPGSENIPRPTPLSRFHPRFKELHGAGLSSPRGSFSAWRSFSLADLQECDSGTASIASATRTETKLS